MLTRGRQVIGLEQDGSAPSDSQDASTLATNEDAREAASDEPRSIREAYLESKRADLEANYDRLRELGNARRDADTQTLHAIRAQEHKKADFHKWTVCADAAEALISLAFEVATRRY